ncbi:MAG: TatD family deoxyribonuclease [Ruminococcaceae bacterium]|nr:TatD family deoxyribonuclease [Oscillospiraceae bacterium]
MLSFFDSHAHYMDERFDEDRNELLISLNKEENVEYIMNVSYDIPSSYKTVELCDKYNFCLGAVGVHPHDADSVTNSDYDLLRKLCEHKKILAIGETGLDYHYDNSEREKQKIEFANHLDLAKELKLPVIIHEREAVKDALDIVLSKDNVGVFHCFSGSVETARILLNKGYYISFAGPVTFKNAKYVKEVAKYVPHDRFLIETDCPYLAPHPKRGERNNSSNLKYIVEEIATLREDTVENIAKLSFDNARRLFGV